jgi:ArsR family transcriptional regulator, zinc-responsive transcriptional repressor
MKCPSYNLFFETISTPLRLKIICLLKKKQMSVGEICIELGEEQSKISHNLKALSDCHIIKAEQKGKQRIYFVNKETIVPLLKIVEQHTMKYCCNECKNLVKTK